MNVPVDLEALMDHIEFKLTIGWTWLLRPDEFGYAAFIYQPGRLGQPFSGVGLTRREALMEAFAKWQAAQ